MELDAAEVDGIGGGFHAVKDQGVVLDRRGQVLQDAGDVFFRRDRLCDVGRRAGQGHAVFCREDLAVGAEGDGEAGGIGVAGFGVAALDGQLQTGLGFQLAVAALSLVDERDGRHGDIGIGVPVIQEGLLIHLRFHQRQRAGDRSKALDKGAGSRLHRIRVAQEAAKLLMDLVAGRAAAVGEAAGLAVAGDRGGGAVRRGQIGVRVAVAVRVRLAALHLIRVAAADLGGVGVQKIHVGLRLGQGVIDIAVELARARNENAVIVISAVDRDSLIDGELGHVLPIVRTFGIGS